MLANDFIVITSDNQIGPRAQILYTSKCYTQCQPILLEFSWISIDLVEPYMPDPKTTEPVGIVPATEEFKEQNSRYNLSKFEFDLYHEEDDVAEKIIRVKKVSLPNNGEDWKIMENNKTMFVVEGAKLTKKEKEFLYTPDGFNFLINQYKQGIKSFNALKNEIKKKLK